MVHLKIRISHSNIISYKCTIVKGNHLVWSDTNYGLMSYGFLGICSISEVLQEIVQRHTRHERHVVNES